MYGTRYLERINRFLLFLFLLDTGGWLQVRLAVIILFLLQYLIRSNSAFKGSILLAWGFMVILMLPPLFNAFNGGVELSKSLLYIYPLLIFPMFYVIFTSIGVSSETFIGAMRYFAVFVIGFFMLRVFLPSYVEGFVQFLRADTNAGFFDRKTAFLGPWMPVVYFKATLIMVPAAVLTFYKRRWRDFILFLTFLIVAPSRTGVFVVLIFGIINMYHTKYKYIFKRVIPVILFVLIVTIFSDIPEIATSILDAGAAPRLLHFPAVWNYFSGRPIYFLFGGGPGSVFFTEAFIFQENGGWTDDSEISQLEALRRYGVFFTMYLLFLFVKLSKKTVSEGLSAFSYALWSFFLVAASNPVLLTTPAIIFYSITVVELTIPQLKKKRNGESIRRYSRL